MGSSKAVKRVIISAVSLLAAAGIGTGIVSVVNKNSAGEAAESAYREYTASKGSITVGTSESGTASIGRSYISFPVSAEVEEVYVSVGSAVKDGDKLAKINTDDVDDVISQYESKLLNAKLELEAAKNESQIKLLQAENTYTSSVNKSGSAEQTYELSLTKIQREIVSSETNLEDLKEQLAEYEQLAETYPEDYKVYSEYDTTYSGYEDKYDEYKEICEDYEDELADVKEEYNDYLESVKEDLEEVTKLQENIEKAKESMESAKEAYEKALSKASSSSSSSDSSSSSSSESSSTESSSSSSSSEKSLESAKEAYEDAQDAYNKACNAYTSTHKSTYLTIQMHKDKYDEKISALEDKIDEYKDMMEEYSKKMSKYKEEADDYNSDYNELYGNMDGDDIADKIEKLKSEIESAEYELEKLKLNTSDSELSALQDMQTTLIEAASAESVYNQTVEQINKNVSDKQEEYDDLLEEYETLMENLGDGLYIYADCDGSVSSVSISEGDTIMANQSVVTVMDSSEIYVSVSVSEDDIASLSVGQAASVTFSAYENVNLDGEIDTIAVEPSRSSGSVAYEVTVKVTPNENMTIYESMTCDVTFLQKQVSDVIYVNVQAVEYKGSGLSAVLVYDENGNIVEREVVTGFSDGRYVEIVSGLSAGDTVLAESAVKLA